jgi:hypothetical protein
LSYKIYALLGVFAVIGLAVLYGFEYSWFDRTIGMPGLVKRSLLVGGLSGLLAGWYLQRQAKSRTEQAQMYVIFVVLGLVLAPLLASLSNRLLTPWPAQQQPLEFIDEEGFYSDRAPPIVGEDIKPDWFHLTFYYEGKLRRIKNKKSYFRHAERGDSILLSIKPGLWGFDVVQRSRIDGNN